MLTRRKKCSNERLPFIIVDDIKNKILKKKNEKKIKHINIKDDVNRQN